MSARFAGPDHADAIPTPARPGLGAFRAWVVDCFSLDVRSLALFRMALALILLCDLGIRAGELTTFHSDAGIVPRSRLTENGYGSIHALSGSVPFETGLFAVHALFALAMLVGYRTRLATFVSCFLLISLHLRNPLVLQGGDALLRVLLFWGIFLPLGAVWSVDAHSTEARVPKRTLAIGSAALILQLCFLYWFSAALKNDPAWTRDGTAVAQALHIDQLVKPAGQVLLGYPELCRVLTYATFALELVGPLLLFVPIFHWQIRLAVVIGFLAFHLFGLNLCMELGPFPYVCAAGWVALLPTQFWDRLAAWRGRASQLADGAILAPAGFNVLTGLLLAYVLLWNVRGVLAERVPQLLPQSLNPIGFTFGLDQYWAMFSPHPPQDDGWFVCEATLNNGERVDLLRDGQPVDWSKPPLVSALYPNERWRKYMMNLPRTGQDESRVHLIRFLWDRWNRSQPPARQVKELHLYYVLEETLPDCTTAPPRPLLLGWCLAETLTVPTFRSQSGVTP